MKKAVRALLSSADTVLIRQLIGRRLRVFIALACMLGVTCLSLAWRARSQPREWAAHEVPVVFWSWQSSVPSQESVQRVIVGAGARGLFLRAGQIDYERGTLRRIRAVTGPFPQGIALQLVYNATSGLLAQFETTDLETLASTVCDTYAADLSRASAEGVRVSGLQLDIDVPTRLLSRYERVLRMIRLRLPDGTSLSITGLPTWMTSPALRATLEAVDFWIPQCYGAEIPVRLDHAGPISSKQQVANEIDRARGLGKPFYAGLAAYGYAIHFGRDGRRVQISGSLDPGMVASHASLELVERRRFDPGAPKEGDRPAGEWRYVYRARESCKVGEFLLRQGEWLMLDLPASDALRAIATAVRKRAGEGLLGICIFRLPGDATTLTVEEIAAALSDTAPASTIELRASVLSRDSSPDRTMVEIMCSNKGTESGLLGVDALRLDLNIGGARLAGLGPTGFDSSELLFVPPTLSAENHTRMPAVCAVGRANVVRFSKCRWNPGNTTSAILEFAVPPADTISLVTTVRIDEGRVREETRTVTLERITARE